MVQWSNADSAYVGGGEQNYTFHVQLLNEVQQHCNMSTNDSYYLVRGEELA